MSEEYISEKPLIGIEKVYANNTVQLGGAIGDEPTKAWDGTDIPRISGRHYHPIEGKATLPESAKRFNTGKSRMSKLFEFGSALHMLIKVMEQGAIKYDDGNWLKGGKPDEEYIDSALRHIEAFVAGEFYDPDIGTAHLGNAAWNLLAALCVNYGGMETLDPDFDQETFMEKYND